MKPQWFRLALLLAIALAQGTSQTAPNQTPANSVDTQRLAIRQRGNAALEKEQNRSKSDVCAKARAGGNAAIGACLVAEGKATEQSYLIYIRSIGSLLRLSTDEQTGAKPAKTPRRLTFDSAEESWQSYRDQSCVSMVSQWDGGDQAQVAYPDCRLTLTWRHMNELSELYSDLFH